jgi:hypothetical protein
VLCDFRAFFDVSAKTVFTGVVTEMTELWGNF